MLNFFCCSIADQHHVSSEKNPLLSYFSNSQSANISSLGGEYYIGQSNRNLNRPALKSSNAPGLPGILVEVSSISALYHDSRNRV